MLQNDYLNSVKQFKNKKNRSAIKNGKTCFFILTIITIVTISCKMIYNINILSDNNDLIGKYMFILRKRGGVVEWTRKK